MTRSEAFRKAWATVKAAAIETKVTGVTYGNRQTALEHLTRYDADKINVSLARETANEYDRNAIAVIVTVTDKGSYTIYKRYIKPSTTAGADNTSITFPLRRGNNAVIRK